MKEVLILGPGCPKCRKLAERTERAVAELVAEITVRKVTEIAEIMQHGVMMTPALVVDGEVKCVGQVPSRDEIKEMLA